MSQQFLNNLQNANDYLNNTQINVPTAVDVTPNGVTMNQTSFSLKELICSLLAGNGLKLPNLQICLKANIGQLLNAIGININPALDALRGALNKIDQALDDFIAHTKIDAVLDRLNQAIAQFAAIANMINFCGTPIQPNPIPNVLADMFGSFTGQGKALLDNIGKMFDSEIGGCLNFGGSNSSGIPAIGGFKPIFASGILADIQNNLTNLANLPAATVNQWTSSLDSLADDLKNLIAFENSFASNTTVSGGKGGSTFTPVTRINKDVGVGIDPDELSLAEAQRLAGNLQSAFDQLESYKITDDGKSVFDFIIEPEMLARMRNQTPPEISEVTRTPTYDYCGRVTGYVDVPNAAASNTSGGDPVQNSQQPGIVGSNPNPVEGPGISVQELKNIANSSTNFQDFVAKLNNL